MPNGLIVGNDVTFYGLFVEHRQQYQTLWNGNNGRVYFYQCEMPCDPPAQKACRMTIQKHCTTPAGELEIGVGRCIGRGFGISVDPALESESSAN